MPAGATVELARHVVGVGSRDSLNNVHTDADVGPEWNASRRYVQGDQGLSLVVNEVYYGCDVTAERSAS